MTRKFNGQSIVIASHNSGKIFEFEELFANSGYHITSASQLGFPEPVEDGLSFKENAEIKARASALLAGYPSISDDSGLVVPLINDEPGIHSARWALTKSGNKNFNLAIERIENKIVALGETPSGQKAYFVCALTMCWPDGYMETVEGYVHGKLTFPSKGNKGFVLPSSLIVITQKSANTRRVLSIASVNMSYVSNVAGKLNTKYSCKV